MQREMICLLLEESDMDVIECESAEAAELVLEEAGASLVLMLTDVQLAGLKNGVELAHVAKKFNPDMDVIVTSGKPLRQDLPDGAKFWTKPWVPLDVIREAERMSLAWSQMGEA
jgi:CheY-like chemotaxis protein